MILCSAGNGGVIGGKIDIVSCLLTINPQIKFTFMHVAALPKQ